MVSTQEQETLQLRALKLQTPIKGLIKGTFPLSSFTLRAIASPLTQAQPSSINVYHKEQSIIMQFHAANRR